jgi:hypothetical protein
MRRELRSVRTEEVLGAVTDGPEPFEGAAADVLSGLRRQLGDAEAAARVLRDGWSNGYLYLAEPAPQP